MAMTMFWKEIMGLWQLRARLATSSQEDGRWFLTYSDDEDEDDPCNGSDDDTSNCDDDSDDDGDDDGYDDDTFARVPRAWKAPEELSAVVAVYWSLVAFLDKAGDHMLVWLRW